MKDHARFPFRPLHVLFPGKPYLNIKVSEDKLEVMLKYFVSFKTFVKIQKFKNQDIAYNNKYPLEGINS